MPCCPIPRLWQDRFARPPPPTSRRNSREHGTTSAEVLRVLRFLRPGHWGTVSATGLLRWHFSELFSRALLVVGSASFGPDAFHDLARFIGKGFDKEVFCSHGGFMHLGRNCLGCHGSGVLGVALVDP